MNTVESIFKTINKMKEKLHFSMDLYYNDIDDTFVVKLQTIIGCGKQYPVVHFRNPGMVESLLEAYHHLRTIVEKK